MSFTQHNTMESLLERGEKIDDLVSKSEVLGVHSKAFYKTVGALGRGRHPFLRAGSMLSLAAPHDSRLPRNVQRWAARPRVPVLSTAAGGSAGAKAGGSLSLTSRRPTGGRRLRPGPALLPLLSAGRWAQPSSGPSQLWHVAPSHLRLSLPIIDTALDSVCPHTFTLEGGGQWGGGI